MTPNEFKRARQALGLSARELALALKMSPSSGRTVRRWEAGESGIPSKQADAVRDMLAKAIR